MNKSSFRRQFKKSMGEIEINPQLKRKLAHQFFSEPQKKPFWNWTKVIFTAPVVALFAIIFLLSSNQETVKQMLLPQEALAQALENTFNLENLETTFGLPKDGKPHHRNMTYNNSYSPDNEGVNVSPQNIDLWLDGKNVRLDQFEDLPDFVSKKPLLNSKMFLADKNLFCSHLDMEGSDIECIPGMKPKIPFSISSAGPLYSEKEETMIHNVGIKAFYDETKGPGFYLEFSTSQPIHDGQVSFANFRGGSITVITLPNEGDKIRDIGKSDYVNKLKDGKYWARLTLNIDTPFKDNIYFQVQQVKNSSNRAYVEDNLDSGRGFDEQPQAASMIYLVNTQNEEIKSLTEDQFNDQLKEYSFSELFMDDVFYSSVLPVLYIIQHSQYFSEPLKTQIIKHGNDEVWQVTFSLPKSYFIEMSPRFYDPKLNKKGDYTIDLFLNKSQTNFLGYSIKQNKKELESLWIKDSILSEAEKSKIFNEEEWKKSFTK